MPPTEGVVQDEMRIGEDASVKQPRTAVPEEVLSVVQEGGQCLEGLIRLGLEVSDVNDIQCFEQLVSRRVLQLHGQRFADDGVGGARIDVSRSSNGGEIIVIQI